MAGWWGGGRKEIAKIAKEGQVGEAIKAIQMIQGSPQGGRWLGAGG